MMFVCVCVCVFVQLLVYSLKIATERSQEELIFMLKIAYPVSVVPTAFSFLLSVRLSPLSVSFLLSSG